jgi:hypothetical protein
MDVIGYPIDFQGTQDGFRDGGDAVCDDGDFGHVTSMGKGMQRSGQAKRIIYLTQIFFIREITNCWAL